MQAKIKFSEMHVNNVRARSLAEQADEIRREIDVRRRIYDRWVADGKLSWTEAQDRLERMLSVLRTLIEVESAADSAEAESSENIPLINNVVDIAV